MFQENLWIDLANLSLIRISLEEDWKSKACD